MNEISYSIYVENDEGFCPSSYDMARDVEEAPSLLDLEPIPPMSKWLSFKKLKKWEEKKWCDDLSNGRIQ